MQLGLKIVCQVEIDPKACKVLKQWYHDEEHKPEIVADVHDMPHVNGGIYMSPRSRFPAMVRRKRILVGRELWTGYAFSLPPEVLTSESKMHARQARTHACIHQRIVS